MPICFRCNAENPKTLADHNPGCPVVKEKAEKARHITNLSNKYRRRNEPTVPGSHGNINRPGKCKLCGEQVKSLLAHLGGCRGKSGDAPKP